MGLFYPIKHAIKRKIKDNLSKTEKVVVPLQEGKNLIGKKAIITGGSSGIGYAIAQAFLLNGAEVIILGRNIDKLNKAAQSLKSCTNNDHIYSIQMDLTKVSTFDLVVNRAIEILGEIDILVNCGGVLTHNPFGKVTEEDWDSVINTNLKGTYFLSQAVSNYMIKNNIAGNILNVGSSSCLRPAISPYTCSKWGIRGFTLGLAKALIPYGIVVNGLAPGQTATPMVMKDNENIYAPWSPAKRYATPEEMANLALFLVGPSGRMVIGDMVYMTGGAGNLTYEDIAYAPSDAKMNMYEWKN